MRNKLLILLAIFPSLVWGQVLDRTVRPSAGPAPTINIKNSEVFKTSNGITVILSENHAIPKVSFNLVLGADPILEGQKAGLADLAGEMMMSGTKNRDKDKLDNEIALLGASLSANQSSVYLSCLTKFADKGMNLFADIVQNPSFPSAEFDRISKQAESALKSQKSEAGAMANSAQAKANFNPSHPYSEVMTEESLKNINLQDVLAFYQMVYVPEGSYLVVVGDIDLAQTKAIVDKYLSSWKGGAVYKNNSLTVKPAAGSQVYFVNKPGAVQSVIEVTYPVNIKPGDEDQIGLTVMNSILGGSGFGSRLMQNLREDKAYTYGCRSQVEVDENGSIFSTDGNFRNEVTDSAIVQILSEIDRMTTEYVTDEQLNQIKSSMAGSFARSLESPRTVARFALNIEKYGLDKDYYKNYLKKLAAIDKEDVLLLSQKYLSAKNVNIVVVGNESILDILKPFDQDGKIQVLDAFGNVAKNAKPADISADQLIEKYILAVTKSESIKKANKKLKKIKSYVRETDFTSAQIPIPLKMTDVWIAPNQEGNKLEGQGMVFQKSYFDGVAGGSSSMQGGSVSLTTEEVQAKSLSIGIYPELNYKKTGMSYAINGIETVDGKEMYTMQINDGTKTSIDYFDKVTFLKMKTVAIEKQGEESVTTEFTFDDYREVNGVLMPYVMNLNAGPMQLDGKVSNYKFNEKVNLDFYKK
ncbi:MAG: pitrilysin family protein [Crocinitomicaceae bacterium]